MEASHHQGLILESYKVWVLGSNFLGMKGFRGYEGLEFGACRTDVTRVWGVSH